MVDAEHYSISASSNDLRYAGVWVKRSNPNVVSNLDLTNTAGWPLAARNGLTSLRNRLSGFQGNVGFVIEDLGNRNWVGLRINEPFYMASTSKVMIAAAVLERVEAGALAVTQNLNYAAADLLELCRPADANCSQDLPGTTGNFTVGQSLRWMLDHSSTNATDRLVRLISEQAVNAYLESSGITDVGEVTSICEIDKRIFESQNACARAMSCVELEQWSRNGRTPASSSGQTCVGRLTRNQDAGHEAYYATLANSVTPLQHGRFWRRLLHSDILTAENTNLIIDMLDDGNSAMRAGFAGTVNVIADKTGEKRGVKSYVGVGYDQVAGSSLTNDRAQYSFSIFTEDWEDNYDQAAAETRLGQIATDAFAILDAFH